MKKTTDTEKTFRRYQRQYLKAEIKNIEKALFEKLEKAFESGHIPEEWKATGNHLLMKAVINSFCKDEPYSHLDPIYRKQAGNLHKFI